MGVDTHGLKLVKTMAKKLVSVSLNSAEMSLTAIETGIW